MSRATPHRVRLDVVGPTSQDRFGTLDEGRRVIQADVTVQHGEYEEATTYVITSIVVKLEASWDAPRVRWGINPYTDCVSAATARAMADDLRRLHRYTARLPVQPTTLAEHVAVLLAYAGASRIDVLTIYGDHRSRPTTTEREAPTYRAVHVVAGRETSLVPSAASA